MQKRACRANAGVAALREMAMTHDTRMRKLTRVAGRLHRRSRERGSGCASRDGCGASRANAEVGALRGTASTQAARMRKWLRFARWLRRATREYGSGRALRDGFNAGRENAGVAALRETAAARNSRMREWPRFAKRLRRGSRECESDCASRSGCGAAVSTPRGTLERWEFRRARGAAGYLPTQKSENTRSMTCSFMVSPVMSPRWARASRRSVAQRSSGRLDSIERMARSSACMA